MLRCHIRTRPASSIVSVHRPIRAAVPKSSITISRQTRPMGSTVGMKPKKKRSMFTGGRASHHARKTTADHLATSDG